MNKEPLLPSHLPLIAFFFALCLLVIACGGPQEQCDPLPETTADTQDGETSMHKYTSWKDGSTHVIRWVRRGGAPGPELVSERIHVWETGEVELQRLVFVGALTSESPDNPFVSDIQRYRISQERVESLFQLLDSAELGMDDPKSVSGDALKITLEHWNEGDLLGRLVAPKALPDTLTALDAVLQEIKELSR